MPQSAWNASVVMVTKPDQSIRFCCDFRGLNEVTLKDCQSLPRIDAVLMHYRDRNGGVLI